MDQNQRNQVQTQLEQFYQIDLSGLLSKSYPDPQNDTAIIGEYTAKDFLSICNKVFDQFNEELKDDFAKHLPYQYQFQNEFGGGDLNSDLTNLLTYVQNQQFPSTISFLNRLIHYQVTNGFWEKSKRKYFRSNKENLKAEKERIELVSKQLQESVLLLKNLIIDTKTEKENLNSFTQVKQKELNEIEALIESARNNSNEINNLLSSSSSISERIHSLANNSETKLSDTDELHQLSKKSLKEIDEVLTEQNKQLDTQNAIFDSLKVNFEDKLDFINSKTDFFEERNDYLNDLIGREVGASLFETFKQRKGELGSGIAFWKWAVPLTTIATIVWIFILFGNGDLKDIAWQIILINSLKALPAIGLLLFVISQYSKERNFQEEYAFKSAVALTINSYANQLAIDENKDKLILDSVQKMYTTPITDKKISAAERKSLIDTAKELTDAAKSIVNGK